MSANRWGFTLLVVAALVAATGLGAGAQPLAALGVADPPLPAAQGKDAVTVPYPGRLSTAAGQPVADGAYELRFALYAAVTGGEPLWTEIQSDVAVRGGTFAVVLGSVVPIPKEVLAGGSRWLEVSVRGPGDTAPTVLAPRQVLSAAAAGTQTTSSCAHTHFGEQWRGDGGVDGYALIVANDGGVGDGIRGISHDSRYDYAGLYGFNHAAGSGVYGESSGGTGVYGKSSGDFSTGVHGETSGVGSTGVYGLAETGVVGKSNTNGSNGVFGENTGNGIGVTGSSAAGFGIQAGGLDTSRDDLMGDILLAGDNGELFTNGIVLKFYSNRHIWFDLDNDNNDPGATFRVYNGDDTVLWSINEPKGDAIAAGSQASAVETKDYGQRLLYAVEGTGVWLEDVGTAALGQGGQVTVVFDPIYAQAANLRQDYQVFVTARGEEFVVLQVASSTATGFTVRGVTLDGRPASCSFDYRVVAPRAGYEDTRLEQYTPEGEEQP